MSALLKGLKFAWDYFVRGKHRSSKQDAWVEPPPLEAQLWFGGLLVADLHLVFPHQGTWFSECVLRISGDEGGLQKRVLDFIAFCRDFDRRIAEGRDHEFDEFDRFGAISQCESWKSRLPNGSLVPMEGRMWFAEGVASWQHPESEPYSEGDAYEFWVQNASGT